MKITAPGRYDVSMDYYHGQPTDGPSVSATGLVKIINECPATFFETWSGNPNRVEDKTTRDLDVGRAAHALVLGEPEFAKYFFVSPYESHAKKPGYTWYNDEWKPAVEAGTERRTLLKADQFDAITAMADAQRRSPQVGRAFEDGLAEQSLLWRDAETNMWVKSRPDWLPTDPAKRPAVDYKTARSIHPRKLGAAVFEYGYHVQAAMIVEGIRVVMGIAPCGVAHVVQEKTIPYLAELRMFSEDQLAFGHREYRRALLTFARCHEAWRAGKPPRVAWPGYSEKPEYFATPFYIQKQIEESLNGTADRTADERRADVNRELADVDAEFGPFD